MTDSLSTELSLPEILEKLCTPEFLPGARMVQRSFADLTTLRIGGTPAAVVACSRPSALAGVVSLLDANSVPLLVVGGGSNLVIGEGDDVRKTVVVWATTEQVAVDAGAEESAAGLDSSGLDASGEAELFAADGDARGGITIDAESGLVRAFAGVNFDSLVQRTVEAGLSGLECLSGIPGSVGATPVQNVGAYGAEVSQVLSRVQLFDRGAEDLAAGADGAELASEKENDLYWVGPEDLDLSYRYSNLKFTNCAVVTAVEFQLGTDGLSQPLRFGELARKLDVQEADAKAGAESARRPVADVRATVLELRAGKGMVLNQADHDTWSAGSFFTNPVVEGAAARDAVIAAVREKCGEEKASSMPVYSAGRGGAAEDGAVKPGAGAAGADAGGDAAGDGAVGAATGDASDTERFKFSAAWLIDHAGFGKGFSVEGHEAASLSTKHTLALTNRGSATSADIIALASAVRAGVYEAFGVTLEPEPVWVGAQLD